MLLTLYIRQGKGAALAADVTHNWSDALLAPPVVLIVVQARALRVAAKRVALKGHS
jgi:hypothetical protein